MQQLLDGFNSLQNNYRFHHILEVTLAVGNYLNGTSLKGGAWGFKLDSLERLE
jgi:cytokinesis protein